MKEMKNVTWIDARANPPKESGTYYILIEYIDNGEKELVPDIGLYHKWTDKSRYACSFWQAHPYLNKGFLPINDNEVAYYMNIPEIPHDQIIKETNATSDVLSNKCDACKHYSYCSLHPYYCVNGDVWK